MTKSTRPRTDKRRAEVIAALVDKTERELIQNRLMADFYESSADALKGAEAGSEDDKSAAEYLIKAETCRRTNVFNQKFLDYVIAYGNIAA